MMRQAKDFILETVELYPDTDVYWEWTHPCTGWSQQQDGLHSRGLPWLPCRIDGCNYGMVNKDGAPLHKKWRIQTTDENFAQSFKTKLCPGGHVHGPIEGAETAHWLHRLVPERHVCLMMQKDYVMAGEDMRESTERLPAHVSGDSDYEPEINDELYNPQRHRKPQFHDPVGNLQYYDQMTNLTTCHVIIKHLRSTTAMCPARSQLTLASPPMIRRNGA